MLRRDANELKQQGAIEASQDPNSKVTAADAEKVILDEAKKAGVPTFSFDPNASVEEKAAAAKARAPPGFHRDKQPKVAALATDQDDGTPSQYDLPPPSTAGAVALASPTTEKAEAHHANGHLEPDEKERWERVGWKPEFGYGQHHDDEEGTMLDHQTWLESRLDDKFFGDWYHNAGVIIFACLSSWTIAVLGGGLGWVFLILAFCATYYRTSIRRVRRNVRDDINRQMAKAKLETDNESLEWINSFMVKFWPIYAPVICETIVASVDQVLSTSTPAFLDSLRLKLFTLGTKPPRLEHVKTYPKMEDDIVLMDWKFSFTPNDTADLTSRQIKNKQNPKIVMEVRIGKGMVSKGLDVIVEDMACSGVMRVKMKLQYPFPHIERVDICFLEKPTIDYVCKPLGGDTFGFDINFIPGLEGFIMEQIHANLGPMMYAPNVFPIELAKMLAGSAVDEAVGVLQITFHGAQGLKNPDKFSGTPDPYATVSLNDRAEVARTKTVHENAAPRWNETVNVIVTSLKDSLTIHVYDWNEYRKDKDLGLATFPLEQLEQEDEFENQHLVLMANGRERGIVQADIRFFPVLQSAKLEDGTEEPPPESNTGIAKFTVVQGRELDNSKSMVGELNPYAVLLLNGKEVHVSKKLKRTNNPVFPDASKEMLITDRKNAKLGLVIKDDRDIAIDPILGQYQIKLEDMLGLMHKGQEWYNLANAKTGRVKMQVQWKPVALKGAVAGGGYITPIGVMRLHFINARDLRNLEAMGKSDPYVRVLLSGIEKGRTVVWKNNLNPDFDEVIYVPVHSNRERLTLEVMDQENLQKDRTLGWIELSTAEYVHQNDDGEYETHDTKKPLSSTLTMGRGQPKGTLNYTCSFFPTIPTVDPEEEEREKAEQAALADGAPASPITPTHDRARPHRSGTITSLKSHKSTGSQDLAKKLDAGEHEQEEAVPIRKEIPKIKIGPDDLQKYETGLLVYKLIDGKFTQTGCRVEVLMDDMLFPSYSSPKVRAREQTFNDFGDAVVRELDFSRITLRVIERVNKEGEGKEERVIAKLAGPTLDTLRRCLYKPTELTLKDKDGRENKVTVSLQYLPIKMTLDPSESFNNSGTLRVDVLDAADLPSADRNGFSDPFCRFNLNGKEVYKTKVQKKTLHPAWNEFFECQVRSRTAAKFEVTVLDWDLADKPDFLGAAAINLEILEPFQQQEVSLGLDGKSGAIRLKMLFKPDYIIRSRQGSSTFSGTFAPAGKIVGAPVKGVGKGAVFVGGGVAKGASFLGRGFRRRTKSGSHDTEEFADGTDVPNVNGNGDIPPVPSIELDESQRGMQGNAPSTPHSRGKSLGQHSMASTPGSPPSTGAEGTASVTIVSASGYPAGSNIRIHVKTEGAKAKEVHKTKALKAPSGDVIFDSSHEGSFKLHCSADTQFKIIVKDHATFGSDDDLGEGVFYVGDQGTGAEKEVSAGEGKVVVRSSFQTDLKPDSSSIMTSPSSGKLRRGVFGTRRESRAPDAGRERSVTPGN